MVFVVHVEHFNFLKDKIQRISLLEKYSKKRDSKFAIPFFSKPFIYSGTNYLIFAIKYSLFLLFFKSMSDLI